MCKMIEVKNNIKIDFIVLAITTMLHCLLADNNGYFWQPAEFKNVANPYFGNMKHLQNPKHLTLTSASA